MPTTSPRGTRDEMTFSNHAVKRGRHHSSNDHAASAALASAGALPPPAAPTQKVNVLCYWTKRAIYAEDRIYARR